MSIVSCKESDCQRKVQARGMCTTHYSYWQRASTVHELRCKVCGDKYKKNRGDSAVCSMECRQTLATRARALVAQVPKQKSTDVVKYLRPRVWIGHSIDARKGLSLVAGCCAYCPTYFVGHAGSSYCSNRCKLNAKTKRRYDFTGEFKVTDTMRHSIYMRDKYTCKLCHEPVDLRLHYNDPMSATLDHIVPQSWMLIPDHSAENLRTAHRRCNSARGAGV